LDFFMFWDNVEFSSSRVDVSKKNAREQVMCECTGSSDCLKEKLKN
jgi:hypothetical protein